MAGTPSGHIEQLPSGSWRAKAYAGTDPLTGREFRLRRTCRTERAVWLAIALDLQHAVTQNVRFGIAGPALVGLVKRSGAFFRDAGDDEFAGLEAAFAGHGGQFVT